MGRIRGQDGGTCPAFPAAGIPALLVMVPWSLGDDDILGRACRAGEPDHIAGAGAINFRVLFSFSHCWIPGLWSCGANGQMVTCAGNAPVQKWFYSGYGGARRIFGGEECQEQIRV